MPKISLVINTKNEEAFIGECILSAKNIVDEIIVVDMHSTDKTIEIAKGLGAIIYTFADCGYVEPARSFAISKAAHKWILLLDADERITPQLGELLVSIAEESKYESVRIPRKNIHFNKWTKYTGWWPDYSLRFFQKDKIKWGVEIHTIPEFSENFFTIPEEENLSIVHFNFRSIDQLADKIINYTRHENKLTLEKTARAEDFLNYFEGEFSNRFLVEEGYKDGLHGFMLSKFMEFYRFLEVARLWENNNYQNITDVETLRRIKVDPVTRLVSTISEKKEEIERLKHWGKNLEEEINKSKLDYANLENAYNQQKKELEGEKQKINSIFNDDTLVRLYYSKDWKTILKLYALKKKYLSNDSQISKKINRFVDIFKPQRKRKSASELPSPTPPENLQKNVDYSKELTIPAADKPIVSIIIPVYNGWKMNYRCVKSIIEHTSEVPYEIIFADDCSTDETKNCTNKIANLVHIYNETNLGFLRNCNKAAKNVRGGFILFLNSDTEVMPNWLPPLVTLMEKDPHIGLVGSKLIYPDGRLQEAGGIIWNDASGWNYGKNYDPSAPEYNYVKEVDYISGASILIRKTLWEEIGGFDQRYVPAYCEDSDLAFAVRRKGFKVVYQPLSEVVHFESVSHGKEDTGTKDGKLSIQSVRIFNQKKFYEKWKDVLAAEHFPNATNAFHARDRSAAKKTILVIDHYVPEFDHDAGSKTVFQYLELFVALGLNIKFLGDNFSRSEPYTTILEQMGIEVLYGPWYKENWENWIQANRENIHFVLLNRPHTSLTYISFLKRNTSAKILYYGHDLHFLREFRKYELDQNPDTLASSDQWKSKEQYIYENTDYILTPSPEETDAIQNINTAYKVATILPYFFKEPSNPVTDFSDRKDLLFVGGFGHPPNIDGVTWFCNEVWPIVSQRIKEVRLIIVGSKPTEEILNLHSENIRVTGFVSEFDLKKIYKQTRVAIIPLRYGAGVKGKTVEAMYNGIPIVSTSIGLEGMPGIGDILSSFNNAEAFANELISLYNDQEKLTIVSSLETKYINKYFTWEAARSQFHELLEL